MIYAKYTLMKKRYVYDKAMTKKYLADIFLVNLRKNRILIDLNKYIFMLIELMLL